MLKICLILLLIIALACGTSENRNSENRILPDTSKSSKPGGTFNSLKGFEFYVWEKNGTILYTILPGTNRIKDYKEIHNEHLATSDVQLVKKRIDSIPFGETVLIKYEVGDTSAMTSLKEYMRKRNIIIYEELKN